MFFFQRMMIAFVNNVHESPYGDINGDVFTLHIFICTIFYYTKYYFVYFRQNEYYCTFRQ